MAITPSHRAGKPCSPDRREVARASSRAVLARPCPWDARTGERLADASSRGDRFLRLLMAHQNVTLQASTSRPSGGHSFGARPHADAGRPKVRSARKRWHWRSSPFVCDLHSQHAGVHDDLGALACPLFGMIRGDHLHSLCKRLLPNARSPRAGRRGGGCCRLRPRTAVNRRRQRRGWNREMWPSRATRLQDDSRRPLRRAAVRRRR